MGINESKLTKGQVRKLNALRKSVGDTLAEEVFGKWLAQQAKGSSAQKADAVAVKIEEALASYADDPTFRLGNYGYTIKRARGKDVSGIFVRNEERKTGKIGTSICLQLHEVSRIAYRLLSLACYRICNRGWMPENHNK